MKFLKLAGINVAVFALAILCFESVFILDTKFHFLNTVYVNHKSKRALTPEEYEKKYNIQFSKIPDFLKTELDPVLHEVEEKPFVLDQEHKGKMLFEVTQKGAGQIDMFVDVDNRRLKIYSAHFEMDQYKRRKVMYQDHKKASKFILTLGDSHTFGEGLDNGKDYPSLLAKKIGNDWKVYNLGWPGEGPNDTLKKSESPDFLAGVTESEGIALWQFSGFHMDRFLCPLKCEQSYYAYQAKRPYYSLKDGKLNYEGTLEDYDKNTFDPNRFLIRLLSYSYALKHFGISEIMEYSDSQIEAVTQAYVGIKNRISQTKKLNQFYFIIDSQFHDQVRIKKSFIDHGLAVLDYSEMDFESIKDHRFPMDGHPTSNHNWIMTDLIKNSLQL
ncbi:MAG: hypothetical protein K0R29_833 [Pseudobdellovibrio sp.]|jgi:hypothetical protein|nr:hypothetical protein [Pseudobdellovibrio sp.]